MFLIKIVLKLVASHYTNKAITETSLLNFLSIKMEEILLDMDKRMGGNTKRAIQKVEVHPFAVFTI